MANSGFTLTGDKEMAVSFAAIRELACWSSLNDVTFNTLRLEFRSSRAKKIAPEFSWWITKHAQNDYFRRAGNNLNEEIPSDVDTMRIEDTDWSVIELAQAARLVHLIGSAPSNEPARAFLDRLMLAITRLLVIQTSEGCDGGL